MGAKNDKTNVMRLLDKAGIEYKVHNFNSEDIPSGSQAADILRIEHGRMFKTLVTVAKSGAHYVYMIPVDCELDLKRRQSALMKSRSRCSNQRIFCRLRDTSTAAAPPSA